MKHPCDWKNENSMYCSSYADRGRLESVSPLLVCDLRAQLAPLNRYGPSGLGVAVAEGVRALVGASHLAVAAIRHSPRTEVTT